MTPGFSLAQSYPNPFKARTTVSFYLPEDSKVTLRVFDAQGREVATLVDGQLPSGFHEADFNSKGLAGGIYFYKLHARGYEEVRRLVLLD